ncbi:MAG: Fpg/Nei family DNA glycosylase [Egibacteraceae bacterium]
MPEGHTIHRIARQHREALGGRTVTVSSPQGRFADSAALLDGQTLDDVEAYGKHLFYRWAGGDVLHVHLGLVGMFRTFAGEAPAPTRTTRLAMAADEATVHLAGPMVCELLEPDGEGQILAWLGPDPLRDGRDAGLRFRQALGRRSIPIGAALLDQKVVAGIGNVYRAETLFLCGIHPDRPARSLTDNEAVGLWSTIVEHLRLGMRLGRIVTVDPAEVGAARPEDLIDADDDRLYVYRRGGLPCRRCGTHLRAWKVGGRTITACEICQPR